MYEPPGAVVISLDICVLRRPGGASKNEYAHGQPAFLLVSLTSKSSSTGRCLANNSQATTSTPPLDRECFTNDYEEPVTSARRDDGDSVDDDSDESS